MENFKTKNAIEHEFIAENCEWLKTTPDKTSIHTAWNDFVDFAKKDGHINPDKNWTQPLWVQN